MQSLKYKLPMHIYLCVQIIQQPILEAQGQIKMQEQKNPHQLTNSQPYLNNPNIINLPSLQLVEHPSHQQISPGNISPHNLVDQICRVERCAQQMLLSFAHILDRILQSDKIISEEQTSYLVNQLQSKYQYMMKLFEGLPIFNQKSIAELEDDVLFRHKQAVREFELAVHDAMFWKKQIHAVINSKLQTFN